MSQAVKYSIAEWKNNVSQAVADVRKEFGDLGEDAKRDVATLTDNAELVAKEFVAGKLSPEDAAMRYEMIARTSRARLQTLTYKGHAKSREFALRGLDLLFRVVTVLV